MYSEICNQLKRYFDREDEISQAAICIREEREKLEEDKTRIFNLIKKMQEEMGKRDPEWPVVFCMGEKAVIISIDTDRGSGGTINIQRAPNFYK